MCWFVSEIVVKYYTPPKPSATKRLLMLLIAHHQSQKQRTCAIMSLEAFKRESGANKRTIQRALDDLQKEGSIIIKNGRIVNGKREPSLIAVNIMPPLSDTKLCVYQIPQLVRHTTRISLVPFLSKEDNMGGVAYTPQENKHPADIEMMAKELGITPVSGRCCNYDRIRALYMP